MIRNSAVRKFLEDQGYQIIGFDSGFSWTNLIDADFYLAPNLGSVKYMGMSGGANEFEVMLMETSAHPAALRCLNQGAEAAEARPEWTAPHAPGAHPVHPGRAAQDPALALAQVHLRPCRRSALAVRLRPQRRAGGRRGRGASGYRDQLIYINKLVLPVLQQIIADSETPPIIIVQADHGGVRTNLQDRMRILNAYYLPDGGEKILYPSISPVNTFRLIFNRYFGTNYPLLDDTAYHSGYEAPYDYAVVKDSRPGCP